MRINRTLLKASIAGLAFAGTINCGAINVSAASVKANATATKWAFGPTKEIGNGKASSFIKLDSTGNPLAMGFMFSDKCFTGLPPGKFDMAASFELQMPSEFNHLEMDWNPQGHDPKPIYGVPHFDFHFYLCDD